MKREDILKKAAQFSSNLRAIDLFNAINFLVFNCISPVPGGKSINEILKERDISEDELDSVLECICNQIGKKENK